MADKNNNPKVVMFDGTEYTGSKSISTSGDTIAQYYAPFAKKGQLYTITYTNKKNGDGKAKLTTQQESGEWSAGDELRINRTSDWGKTIDDAFYEPSRQLEITTDYSKKPWYSKWIYKLFGYKKGGRLMRLGGKIVEVPFN